MPRSLLLLLHCMACYTGPEKEQEGNGPKDSRVIVIIAFLGAHVDRGPVHIPCLFHPPGGEKYTDPTIFCDNLCILRKFGV